ncbi:MAG: FAD-dependent oxidoreductase, partial [Rhodobacteraceae bacterium]|nr:FAD-dependent oxidoreductase [Paracoccaceae bacterium]
MPGQAAGSAPLSRLYDAEAYDPACWPDSHWRATAPPLPPCAALHGRTRADVAIIGAGYAGLNAALEQVEGFGADVVVLEAAQPGWGASGRNGGFVCAGSSKLSDRAIRLRVGAAGARDFAAFQADSVARVAQNLARYAIDADRGPDGELLLAHSAAAWRRMRAAPPAPGAGFVAARARRAPPLRRPGPVGLQAARVGLRSYCG